MELIYTVNGFKKFLNESFRDELSLCCLSQRNIIAFCSTLQHDKFQSKLWTKTNNLNPNYGGGLMQLKRVNNYEDNGNDSFDADYKIYVCDIDKPWDIHLVTRCANPITSIQWDVSSTKLLIAMSIGGCEIWQMKDHLLNDWLCVQNTELPGEEIVSIAWLHQGSRCWLQADKKDSMSYTDKIYRSQFAPSVRSFGAQPVEGWIAINRSGQVCVGTFDPNTKKFKTKNETLTNWRSRVMLADISFNTRGDVLLVVSDGSLSSVISCYTIQLLMDLRGNISITSQSTSSFFVNCHMENTLSDNDSSRLTHLKYMSLDSSEQLIVAAGNNTKSYVEQWALVEQPTGVHPLFQNHTQNSSIPNEYKWIHKSSISCNSLPISIAVPRFPVRYINLEKAMAMFQYIAIAYRDGSVKLVNKHTFQAMATTNLDTGISLSDNVSASNKRRRVMPFLVDMQQTLTGCCLVGIDQNSCLYVMKAVNTRDPVTEMSIPLLVGMLEYLMCLGHDCWDVLATLKQGMVDNVLQRLSDDHSKQVRVMQGMLSHKLTTLKMALYRCNPNSFHRVADSYCKMLLNYIVGTIESACSPTSTSSNEMSPMDKLSMSCSKNLDLDLDTVILGLNQQKREFWVDPLSLQALQPLIQWVSDLIIYLLTSLHAFQSNSTTPGIELIRDLMTVSKLREMLVIFRLWGCFSPSCLPHFLVLSSGFDVLPQFYKLMTKVWLTIKDNMAAEFEEILLDECSLLPSQIMIVFCDRALFGDVRSYQSSIFLQSHPVQFVYGEPPTYIAHLQTLIVPDNRIQTQQLRDAVRQISLGETTKEPLRQCSRCNSLSLCTQSKTGSNPVKNDWEKRWFVTCPCGGQWKLTVNN